MEGLGVASAIGRGIDRLADHASTFSRAIAMDKPLVGL